MSTAKFSTWLNPNGTENYKCRAWVNFNGTGTVAIRASGNVASITDNGTGDYTVNFTTAMPDADYAVNGTVSGTEDGAANGSTLNVAGNVSPTASALRIRTTVNNAAVDFFRDYERVFVAIFR